MVSANASRAHWSVVFCSLLPATLIAGCGTNTSPQTSTEGSSTSEAGSSGVNDGGAAPDDGNPQGTGGAAPDGGVPQGVGGATPDGGTQQGSGGADPDGGMAACSADAECDDGDACTIDSCSASRLCVHAPRDIDDDDACTVDSCDTSGGVRHVMVAIDDGDACTIDACSLTAGVTHEPIACDDKDPCTIDTCSPATGCVFKAGGYFGETFSSNGQGWTLGPTWQIGSAKVSSGQFYGNADPGVDHTPTADNGLAGVVLGGNVPVVVQATPVYMTSPIIDLSGTAGSVTLELWRWLNSDYGPYMANYIDVYTGSSWANLFQSGGPPAVQDAGWTKMAYDVTAYKNATFRIRFGYQITDPGTVAVSGWNIDDVRLMPASSCP